MLLKNLEVEQPSPSMKSSDSYPFFNLEQYSISRKTGFLPDVLPLTRLPAYFEPWECLIDDLPKLIQSEELRSKVLELPLLDTTKLSDIPSQRRAFVVLSFLSSSYIWGYHLTQTPLNVLPYTLAQPLTHVATSLGLRPIACYTSVSLWNYRVSKPISLKDLHALHSFTGTKDESWFYMVPLAIEMAASPCLFAILDCFEAIHLNQPHRISQALHQMNEAFTDMLSILPQMNQQCHPTTFYTLIRPFLAGWSHVPPTPHQLQGGVLFERVHVMPSHWSAISTMKGNIVKCAGGSAGQTPTIQLLDSFLGIRHASKMYYDMRDYLPLGFRSFIQDIESHHSLFKQYLMQSNQQQWIDQFNQLIEKMTLFRNIHLKMVAQYIVSQQYKGGSAGSKQTLQGGTSGVNEIKGTGNTLLMPFLKETRDETERATLSLSNPFSS